MAKLKSGLLGPVSGKIGPVVGSSWKNINYVKERPKKKNKNLRRTPAQLANEKKFTFIQQWFVPFYPYITVGFANLASDRTEINAAFSANFKSVFSGIWPDITVDYSKLMVSIGELQGLNLVTIQRTAALKIDLVWERSQLRNISFDDQLMLVLYSPELKIADGFIGGVRRNALSYSHEMDPMLTGQAVEAYLSVTTSDRKSISNSIYLGRIEP